MADNISNHLYYLLWLTLLIYGCSGDGNPDVASSYRISFALSSDISTAVSTRSVVNGKSLPENDTVGVIAYSYPVSSAWPAAADIYDNEPGIIGIYSDARGNSSLTLTEKTYSEITGDKHAFYTYYPYRSELSVMNTVYHSDLMADLEPDGTQIDWMWHSVTGVQASPYSVKLQYSHRMTMIKIMIGRKVDVNVDLKLEKITVGTSDSQKFTFDVATGVVTGRNGGATAYTVSPKASEGGTFIVPLLEDDSDLATETAAQILLLPTSKVNSLSLCINGEIYTTPSDWYFTASAAGLYKLVSIALGVSDISILLGGQEWEEGGDIDPTQREIIIALGKQGWKYDPSTDIDVTHSNININIGAQGWKSDNETETNVAQSGAGVNIGLQDWKEHLTIP